MTTVALQFSNKEDWIIHFSAVDDATGSDIDFTGSVISFKLRDHINCNDVTASTETGSITLPSSTVIEISIPETQIANLCRGTYDVGCVYELNGIKSQLFIGTAAVYNGIATL